MSSSDDDSSSDFYVQKQLLTKLAKYGDSFIANTKTKQKKKKKSLDIGNEDVSLEIPKKSRKKKKRKKENKLEAHDDLFNDFDEESKEVNSKQKHLEKFKEKLGLTEDDIRHYKSQKIEKAKEDKNHRTETKTLAGKNRPPPEVVVFEDPAKRKQNNSKDKEGPEVLHVGKSSKKQKPDEDQPEFDMKRARHEVQRFGIQGFDKQKKEEAQVALAVKLGAIPPKNPYMNYKSLMEKKRQEKVEDEELQAQSKDARFKYSGNKKGKKRDRNDIGYLDGQVGKYRGGMQVLTGGEIDSIKRKKVRR